MKNQKCILKEFASRLFLITFLTTLLFSCNKSSNEIKPFSKTTKFTQTIYNKGTAVLLVEIIQDMKVGPDSLKLQIKNTSGTKIENWRLVFYIETESNYDNTLNYQYVFDLEELASTETKTIVIANHPELPILNENIKISILNTNTQLDNPLSGIYSGNISFLLPSDTVPSKFTFTKGIIQSDGNLKFWMKLKDQYRMVSGQFIDTMSLNAFYQIENDQDLFNCALDTIQTGTNFQINGNQLQFRLKISGQPNDIENRVWFNLFK